MRSGCGPTSSIASELGVGRRLNRRVCNDNGKAEKSGFKERHGKTSKIELRRTENSKLSAPEKYVHGTREGTGGKILWRPDKPEHQNTSLF